VEGGLYVRIHCRKAPSICDRADNNLIRIQRRPQRDGTAARPFKAHDFNSIISDGSIPDRIGRNNCADLLRHVRHARRGTFQVMNMEMHMLSTPDEQFQDMAERVSVRRAGRKSLGVARARHSVSSALIIGAVAHLGVSVGSLAAQSADEIKVSAEQIKTIGIETEPLAQHAAVPKLHFPGRVVIPPHQIRMISAPLAGRVDAVSVSVDASVTRGQILAQLSGPEWTRAQFEFLQAVKQEQFLRATLDREQALSTDRIVSPKQILATKNEYAQATASLSEKRNALKLSGMSDDEIDKLASSGTLSTSLPITAPIDGVVLETSLISGQSVEAMTPLFKIAALSPLWLEIQVPVAKVGRLQPQDGVEVPPDLATGKILSIGNSVDAANQSVNVRAEIAVSGSKLRPQQVVEAQITPAASGEKLWGAHPAAIVRHEGKAYVFVQTDAGFRPQEVELQDETAELAILSGPFDGTERIATKGLVPLKGAWQGLGGAEEE